MEVTNVVLFYSRKSNPSMNCYDRIQNNQLPIRCICLDNPTTRQRAMNGNHIQIKQVPSLLVVTNNGIKVFVGLDKVNGAIKDIYRPHKNEKAQTTLLEEPEFTAFSSSSEEMFETTEFTKPKRKKKTKKKVNTHGPVSTVFLNEPGSEDIEMIEQPKTILTDRPNVMELAKKMEKDRENSEII